MKKQIKICMLHSQIINEHVKSKKLEFIIKSLRLESLLKKIDFVYEDVDPDYLIIAESIYYGNYQREIKKRYNQLIKHNPITIFFSGECIEPDFNIFDYAIVFDRNMVLDDRACRMPSSFKYHLESIRNEINTKAQALKELGQKKGFCNFIYSNGNAHPMRDKIFYKINEYKKVDSLGRHLKNAEIEDEKIKSIKNWLEQSVEIKKNYKFSIAAENAQFNGYLSEKLITSFMAHTIPIYFGDRTASQEFNKASFIDCNDYNSLDELLEKIKYIDANDDVWCDMIMQPWQTNTQYDLCASETKKYLDFVERIFLNNKYDMYRKPQGFHPNNYRESFGQWNIKVSFANKIKKSIKHIMKMVKLR